MGAGTLHIQWSLNPSWAPEPAITSKIAPYKDDVMMCIYEKR